MAKVYSIHPDSPQSRQVEQVRADLAAGAVMLYPTDTVYAIGCDMNSKAAVQRVRQIKRLANEKPLTFLCASLSDIARYAYVSDPAYRLMRHLVPGPFTFVLPTTKLVPKLVMNPKRKTTGIRVPDHAISQALLAALGNPIISTSATLTPTAELDAPPNIPDSQAVLFDYFDPLVDIMIDSGQPPTRQFSTVLDLCQDEFVLLRQGLGWADLTPYLNLVTTP